MVIMTRAIDVQFPEAAEPQRKKGYYLNFTEEEYQRIREKSDETGIPVAVIIRSLLKAYIEAEPTERLAETT